MSVIVVPEPGSTRIGPWLSWIPLFSALAVSDCLSGCTGLAVSVKWPNDLLIGDKKIGGILCEQTTTADRTLAIVIGIGLNINAAPDSFPEELRAGATTMAAEAGHRLDRAMILADLLLRLEQRMDRLFHDGPSGMIDEFTRRCSTLGKTVRVALEENGIVEGDRRVDRPGWMPLFACDLRSLPHSASPAAGSSKRGSHPRAGVKSDNLLG
jgi:BirA family biotin operon repressor/biotin-[acetyl-CoA-carboxylase] ligase